MIFIKIGVFFCITSIVIGAFGAHLFEDLIADNIDTFKTGLQYHMFHALALIIIGILSVNYSMDLNLVGYLFITGIFLFSGSLYLIAICKYSFLGIVAPIGGLSLIFAWTILLYNLNKL